MKISFATNNDGKWMEAIRILQPLGFHISRLSVNFIEPDAGTVEEVARIKLEQVRNQGDHPVFVDDAGIFFAAYNQFPGVLTKRIYEKIGYKGIKKLLEGESRDAYFAGAIALRMGREIQVFSGKTEGIIINFIPEKMGHQPEFPFDPLFIPSGAKQVMSHMSLSERWFYSYRRKALIDMANWII